MDNAPRNSPDVWLRITLSPVTVLTSLLAVTGLLLLGGFAVNYDRYVLGGAHLKFLYGMLNVDFERNVPSVFSALSLLCSAILLLWLCRIEKTEGRHWYVHYLSLAMLFLLLSCDELVGFHERVGDALARHWNTESLLALGSVVMALVILPPLVVYVWRWLFVLPRDIALVMILSAAIFLAGAVGLELVSMGYAKAQGTKANLGYQMLALLEEALEMIGVALFNYALLSLVLRQRQQVVLRGARFLQVRLCSRAVGAVAGTSTMPV